MHLHLSSLTFSDGTKVTLSPGDTVFLVGPNNSGKSATLKEIDQHLTNKAGTKKVLLDVEYQVDGTVEALIQRFDESYRSIENFRGEKTYFVGSSSIPEPLIRQAATRIPVRGTEGTKPFFVQLLTTENRLTAANAAQKVDYQNEGPRHPIHELEINDDLEKNVNELFEKAFNQSLMVDRAAGKLAPLVVGSRPVPEEGEDRLSFNYMRKISSLPRIETQGDGMRSFVGIVLNTQITDKDISLIDEPEAFLHPIQVRMLGGILCNRNQATSQALISTHSGEILRAAIAQSTANVKIVRLQRNGNVNSTSVLDNENLNSLWQDTLLRHSNILDGIFHRGVILCESDSDCRFFSTLLEESARNSEVYPDVLFAHCGGKDRMNVAVDALKALDVPVKSICDIDLVRDKSTAKKLFEAHQGDWGIVDRSWEILQASIRDLQSEISVDTAKREIDEVFSGITGSSLSKSNIIDIQNSLRRASPWKRIKSDGKSAIPSGDSFRAFEDVLNKFEEKEIHVLQCGELEGFVRTVGGHGPKWVNEVFERYSPDSFELKPARAFIEKVCDDFFSRE